MAGLPRLGRVLAVARRDLAAELKGRQGLILPAVMAALLLPASAVPIPEEAKSAMEIGDPKVVVVSGDVPERVAALDSVVVREHGPLRFTVENGREVLHGPGVTVPVRQALDAGSPAVIVEPVPRGFVFPGRSMLLALISASTLTGAVSTSVGGERSQRTLVVLLASAISRGELVLGKWLAWGGLGVTTSLVAAATAIALGNLAPGNWLLPMVSVPLATVAFGLWLVRRSGDVIAGSTTALRVLPAAMGASGLIAWFLGRTDPHLGALVPVGGALIAAGDTWAPVSASLLATGVSLAVCAVCLLGTARDLEEVPNREPPEQRAAVALALGSLAAVAWWLPLTVPLLWAEAGNERLTAQLSVDTALMAGAIGLLTFSLVRAGRASDPATALGWWLPRGALPWVLALGAGVLLAGASPAIGWLPLATWGFLGDAQLRLSAAVQPLAAPWWVLGAVIAADELFFRGWLPRAVGPWWAGAVYVAVRTPLDPLGGGLVAVIQGLVAHHGGVAAAVLSRVAWAAVALGAAALGVYWAS